METRLAAWIKGSAQGDEAEAVLRACVHCGFCNATCPTYQLLGDELDGPRGRIYQIKQLLEGTAATTSTQLHLDRCLTCRNCETTCPSGVEYGRLLDVGRAVVAAQLRRPLHQRLLFWLLREGLSHRRVFGAAYAVGRTLRWVLPGALRSKLAPHRAAGPWPQRNHARKVVLFEGCTQPAMAPSIDAASARVLDSLAVQTLRVNAAGCCGAIRHHLDDQPGALANARRNIDAWWPLLQSGQIEAIVVNASGCALMLREYARLLRTDPQYAARAERVSQATRELCEFLLPELPALQRRARLPAAPRIALQTPCTLQHGLKIRDQVEPMLRALGAQQQDTDETHLCCGSAGTYSLLQPTLSRQLRDRKLEHLLHGEPQLILSSNIGCLSHLATGTSVPVWHWIEWVDKVVASD
ncbi:MAG TPA: glycolate oxidase subunit GlcF [Steroidobacteraceae bacterium]|jgi:glycolate oxidase iron-sulfur subunit